MRLWTLTRFALPLVALATLGIADARAQALTLDEAKTAMDAAEAEARSNGWNLTIVIAGADGVPLHLRRMDGASTRSYDIAMGKVRTALAAGMHRLPRQVPLKKAMGMMLTGRTVSAAEGKEIGFVTEVVPQGKALEEARRWAGLILECSPMAIKATKETVLTGLNTADFKAALKLC